MAADLTTFIVNQLAARGIRTVGADSGSKNMKAWCFNGHDRKAPSLSIRKADGAFYCFGCGARGKNWNALAAQIGGETLAIQDLPNPFLLIHENLSQRLARDAARAALPWDLEPWTFGTWRSLPQKFIRAVGACKWYDDDIRANRIFLPIYQQEELMGWVARRLDKPKGPDDPFMMKYRNSANLPAQDILYPYDFIAKRNPRVIVVVEGPFDALRLIRYGIPALAIMGTNNYSRINGIMIASLVDRVIICTDSDKAGKACRVNTLLPAFLDLGLKTEHFFPPNTQDPGNMPRGHVKQLKCMVGS